LDVLKNNSIDKKYLKIKDFENSYSKTFLGNFFFNEQLSEMKKYREINCKDILIDNQHFMKSENPDVSIIITVYNQANCFFSCLRSVQNQSLKNIEIIIIDDCSLDNTTEIMEKYMLEDKRIIYLKHESNDGKIKSRSDGVRLAKGKYICIIDGDDALSHKDILYNSFTIANNSDIDVI
jgi:cellulose synthase/poly-beta-1,6-N-acetylglucosamine synthase-like glycosyltransferase